MSWNDMLSVATSLFPSRLSDHCRLIPLVLLVSLAWIGIHFHMSREVCIEQCKAAHHKSPISGDIIARANYAISVSVQWRAADKSSL